MYFDNEGDQNNHQPSSDSDETVESASDQQTLVTENTKHRKLVTFLVAIIFAGVIIAALWLLGSK
jgi:hypothetical protein